MSTPDAAAYNSSPSVKWSEKMLSNLVKSTSVYFNGALQQCNWKCKKCNTDCETNYAEASRFSYLCLDCMNYPQNQIGRPIVEHSINDVKEK